MKRRQILSACIALTGSTLVGMPAFSQTEKPLRVIVGFPGGVSIDVVVRILSDKLKEELKRPVIVDNRPGAGGRLAAEVLKSSVPDGNTVMVTPIVVPVLAPMVFNKLSYNAATDFAPVVRICDFSFGLAVSADTPVKNLAEYSAWIKANPKNANFGSPAAGSLPHFFGEMIGSALAVDIVHVPFNGGAALQAALLGNHIPAGIDVVFEWLQNAKDGLNNASSDAVNSRHFQIAESGNPKLQFHAFSKVFRLFFASFEVISPFAGALIPATASVCCAPSTNWTVQTA